MGAKETAANDGQARGSGWVTKTGLHLGEQDASAMAEAFEAEAVDLAKVRVRTVAHPSPSATEADEVRRRSPIGQKVKKA